MQVKSIAPGVARSPEAFEPLPYVAPTTDWPDVDIIDICTPPNLHLEQIKRALESRKHVICEKPLVGGLASLDSVSGLVNKSGCQVMPIFQYRFGHGLQKLKYLVDRKLTGEAFVFNVDAAWWRSSEALRDETELPVTLMDARATLEVIAGTYYSSQTGEPVVLPIGPGHPKYETL